MKYKLEMEFTIDDNDPEAGEKIETLRGAVKRAAWVYTDFAFTPKVSEVENG